MFIVFGVEIQKENRLGIEIIDYLVFILIESKL